MSMRFLEMMLIMILPVLLIISSSSAELVDPPDDCNNSQSCGNMEIEYPFSTSEKCAMASKFFINCSTGEPILGNNLLVTNISIQNHEISIEGYVAKACYDQKGNKPFLRVPSYTISSSKNKFIVIGCDSYAYLLGRYQNDNNSYSIGCTTTCTGMERVSANGICSGIGCCQTDIPAGLQNTEIKAYTFYNHSRVKDFNNCTYAFVVEQGRFNFYQSFLENFTPERQPLVLEWAIDNDTCGGNATAYNLEGRSGYYCTCNHGYFGNPYLSNSCTDIDECKTSTAHSCSATEKCVNTQGGFKCERKDQLLVIKITVAMELEGLRKTEKHPWVNEEVNMEEIEYLLAETSNANDGIITTSAYDSIGDHVTLEFSGR
ncbi:hypothetical protein FEM48_Zijuj01G0326400 [Ziziphus jujuba var. spinosa]|uniref:Wall-associated receptor kinase 2-like n=1 Tax=Ziziphus jujuba var. spinosa TaxID=714518 RepID=A0A978W6L1_ZIZJJ|nr:hypothetical protein FEM48_Zijuj01G0326400 [Ziziphus jujuba var. spinosa]